MNKFNPNDAIVVIDGVYEGWVGYVRETEIRNSVPVILFDSEGDCNRTCLDIDYVKNVEPALKSYHSDYLL